MLEREIETEVCKYAREKYDALAHKFTSPRRRSVPDRLFLFRGGITVFIEFKATGKKPTTGQLREIERLRERNHFVHVCDDIDQGRRIVDHYGKMSDLFR